MIKITADTRPSDYEYAMLSKHVYGGKSIRIDDNFRIQTSAGEKTWIVKEILFGKNGYFGVIYQNMNQNNYVVAHRGTVSFVGLAEDISGVFFNNTISPQKQEAYRLTQKAIEIVREYGGQLSFTGHSTGAYLAELSLFYCYTWSKSKKGEFDIRDNAHAVTFEGPGSKEAVDELYSNHEGQLVDIRQLDIISYLSYPNSINTLYRHIGTIYHISPQLTYASWYSGLNRLTEAHSMKNIVRLFERHVNQSPPRVYMIDWPVGEQSNHYFDRAIFQDGFYVWKDETAFNDFVLNVEGHFRANEEMSNYLTLPLKILVSKCGNGLKSFVKFICLVSKIKFLFKKLKRRSRPQKFPLML